MSKNYSELIGMPEGKTLEFKRDISSPEKIIKTLTAFSNTAGGILIIGVEDKTKKISGIESPLDEEERLCNIISDTIEPRIIPEIEFITVKNKTVIVLEVYPSSLRPHYIKNEGPINGVYYRVGSTNRKADMDLIEEIKRSITNISYDELPHHQSGVDDIDMQAVSDVFLNIRSVSRRDLEALRIVTKDHGKAVPTIGGVLLFGKSRDAYFPDAWIQCGRFTGNDKQSLFDHVEIRTHLPLAVDEIMGFLKKHAYLSADLSSTRRKDVWSIPLTILRESVINALVHCDYSQKGAPVRISFFDDRIEVENPGVLLSGLTIDDIRQGISRLRNRVIGRIFKELGLIEQWGIGIPRIYSEAEILGLRKPLIEEIGMRYRCTIFPKMLHRTHAADKATGYKQPESRPESQPESLEKRIVIILENGPLGKKEISSKLGQKTISGQLNTVIRQLIEDGIIEYTVPGKPGSRLQKYRITSKGLKTISRRSKK